MSTYRSRPSADGPGTPHLRGRAAVLGSLLALLLGLLTPSARAAEGPTIDELLTALDRSPVYVHESAEVGPYYQRSLEGRVAKSGVDVLVVLADFDEIDTWDSGAELATELRKRMAGRGQRILITLDNEPKVETVVAFEWPDASFHDVDRATRTVARERDEGATGLLTRVKRTIDLIDGTGGESGDGTVELETPGRDGEEADGGERERAEAEAAPRSGASQDWVKKGFRFVGVTMAWLFAALIIVLLLVAIRKTVPWLWKRARPTRALPLAPQVYASAREEDETAVRRRAQEEVLRLGEELRQHQATADEHTDPTPLRLALDAYASAGKVLDHATGLPDLAGVLALTAEGRDALEADDRARQPSTASAEPAVDVLPLCFFDPLHGRGERRVDWRAVGSRDVLNVVLCADCDRLVQQRKPPQMLVDRYDGRSVPYTDVPAEHSLWSATGYGSFGDEPLAVRVQRGDFTRAADARARVESG